MPILDAPGLIRDIILVLDSGVIFYSLLFAALFIGQWLRSPIRRIVDVRLAWAVFMFGMGMNSFSFIMSDFYFTDSTSILIWTKIGYLAMMVSLVGFFEALERILPYRTYNAFVLLGLLSIIITIFLPFEFMTYIALFTSLLTFAILVLFFMFYFRITSGEIKSAMQLILVGFIIGFVGYIGRSDFAYSSLGFEFYTIAAVLLVIGLLILGTAAFSGPALDELDWDNQLLELYVIHNSGILLYHHEFVHTVNLDEHLTAAGIAGVQSLLQEITQSTIGLSSLEIGEVNIMFAHGEYFTGVLITKRAYRVLLAKIKDFVDIFQIVFGSEIGEVVTSTEEFKSTKEIVQSIFSIE